MFNFTSRSVDAHLGAIPRPLRRPAPMTVSAPSAPPSAHLSAIPRPPAALLRRRRASRPPPCADKGLRAVVGAIGARTTRLISLVLLRLAHPNSLVLFFSSLFFFLPFLFSIFIDPHFSGLLHVPGISATQASCGKINRIVQNQHLCSPPLNSTDSKTSTVVWFFDSFSVSKGNELQQSNN